MTALRLAEYRTTSGVALSVAQRDALRKIVSVAPTAGAEHRYDLTPGSIVGTTVVDDLAVEIRPKLPIDRLLFLIAYALDPRRWTETPFDYEVERSLFEAVIPSFVAHVRRAFARGLLQSYRVEEAALSTVRGRLRFDDQLRDRFGIFPPAEVRYDEFTEDIDENRLIKAAIARLGRLRIHSDAARRAMRRFDATVGAVRLVSYDPRQLPELTYTRLNHHYRSAVELAKLILRSTSFDLGQGEVRATTFLVDMNRVFEDFVIVALREALGLSERSFPQGAKGRELRLDEGGAIVLKPDLSWWDGEICRFVGDVKYKRTDPTAAPNADLYQLLAYTIATDLPGGLLVYAAGESAPAAHTIVHLGRELHVVALDLEGQPDGIIEQIAGVAERVRWLGERGRSRLQPLHGAVVPLWSR